jgi:hypothetical protein
VAAERALIARASIAHGKPDVRCGGAQAALDIIVACRATGDAGA